MKHLRSSSSAFESADENFLYAPLHIFQPQQHMTTHVTLASIESDNSSHSMTIFFVVISHSYTMVVHFTAALFTAYIVYTAKPWAGMTFLKNK